MTFVASLQERERVVHGPRRLATSVPRDQDPLADRSEGAVAWDDQHGPPDSEGQLLGEVGQVVGCVDEIATLPDDREVGVSGMELRRPDDVAGADSPLAADPAPPCSIVEPLLCLAGELLEMLSLLLPEARRQLGLEIARQPRPSDRMEAREMGPVLRGEGDRDVHPRA